MAGRGSTYRAPAPSMRRVASAEVAREAPDAAEKCTWCGADLGPGSRRRPGRVRCERCGVWTSSPALGADEIDRAYEGWYRPAGGRFAGPGDALLRHLRGRLAARLDSIAPPGPVLDVGSGEGALLDALEARGRSATGLERHATDPRVRSLDLAEVDGPWAAIVFWHSLEHLEAPGTAIDHAAAILAPGGVLVVAAPNADSIQGAVLGDRWLALDLPRHRAHIGASALLARLSGLGLRVERTSHLRGGQVVFGWLHGLVGSLPGHPDLYDSIRRPGARRSTLTPGARLAVLACALLLLPIAAALALIEATAGRGGSVYVEARRV
jgi:SAM-dependent methyltransferase